MMKKCDQLLAGMGLTLGLTVLSAINTFFTNKRVRKAAKSVHQTSDLIHKAISDCTVNVRRNGVDVRAVKMITPGLLGQQTFRK